MNLLHYKTYLYIFIHVSLSFLKAYFLKISFNRKLESK